MSKICGTLAASALLAAGASAALAQDAPRIGLVQIDLSNPFHLGEVDGASEAARRNGFELVVTSGEGDVTKQIQAVENMINEGLDAISVNFIDAAAFGPTMQKAEAAGIPIICLHSKIDGCAATLGFDERYTGRIVGEHAAELLKQKFGAVEGEVANLQGLLGQGLNTDRSGGFTDVMAEHPGVTVVAQEPTNWDPTRAVQITENWLTAYPDLDLIYGNSDSLTVPAATVVDRAGKAEDIMLVSVDGSTDGLDAVKSGALKSTVLLAPQYSGYWKAYFPFLVATGKATETEHLIQGVLVTSDNIDPTLKLAADQTENIEEFPFEKPLAEIVETYQP